MTTATATRTRQLVDVTPSATSITFPVDAFKRAVAWATHCASKDEYLATLKGVHLALGAPDLTAIHYDAKWDRAEPLVGEGTVLTMATTDRYRLCWATLAPSSEAASGSVDNGTVDDELLVDALALAKAVKGFKPSRHGLPTVTLTFHRTIENRRHLEVRFVDTYEGVDTRLHLEAIDGQFPKYKSLAPTEFTAFAGALSVAPDLLGAFCTTAKAVKAAPFRMRTVQQANDSMYTSRPIAVAAGLNGADDDVRMSGLLMPVRIGS